MTNILLVDDEPEILNALNLRLGSEYKVHITTDPAKGLQILKDKGPFPVVISDFRMPTMNGIDFLLEANKISPETSSVLLTGQGEYDTAIQALNSGKIFKYLSKPCETSEINEVLLKGIEKFKNKIDEKFALKEYDNENRVAKIVQDQMLFTKFRPINENVELTALSSPKSGISGDFYEIIPHNKNCFDLIIADVMGKGLPAAILGAAIKNSVMHQLQVLKAEKLLLPSLSEIIVALEEEVHESLIEARMFITMLYARVDLINMRITYISNGHPGSLVIRNSSPETVYLQSTHMPLGIIKREFFKSVSLNLVAGDKLVFYTDGISEALVESAEDDPVELILDCLDGTEKKTSQIAKKIFDQAKIKRGVEDDMTVISMNLSNKIKELQPMTFVLQKNIDEIYRLNVILADTPGRSDSLFSVAIMEVFSNLVKHTGSSERALKIICSVTTEGRKSIQMIYEGDHFEPSSIKLPDCSKQVDGFGLFLVEKICYSVGYEEVEGGCSKIILIAKLGEEK